MIIAFVVLIVIIITLVIIAGIVIVATFIIVKNLLKLPASADAKSHWLHFYGFKVSDNGVLFTNFESIVDHVLLQLITNCWLLNVSCQYLIPRLRLLFSKWFTFFSTSNNQSITITFSADISRCVNGHWLRSRLLFHLIQWSSIYEINAIFFSPDSVLTQDSWMGS